MDNIFVKIRTLRKAVCVIEWEVAYRLADTCSAFKSKMGLFFPPQQSRMFPLLPGHPGDSPVCIPSLVSLFPRCCLCTLASWLCALVLLVLPASPQVVGILVDN